MTIDEKLQFIADRVKDEKQFSIGAGYVWYHFRDSKLMYVGCVGKERVEDYSPLSLNCILSSLLELKPQWEFTEDEKVILRNLPDEFRWIARDDNGDLCVFKNRPEKEDIDWVIGTSKSQDYEHYKYEDYADMSIYEHLFQSIQWSDDEPCEFRKYL